MSYTSLLTSSDVTADVTQMTDYFYLLLPLGGVVARFPAVSFFLSAGFRICDVTMATQQHNTTSLRVES